MAPFADLKVNLEPFRLISTLFSRFLLRRFKTRPVVHLPLLRAAHGILQPLPQRLPGRGSLSPHP